MSSGIIIPESAKKKGFGIVAPIKQKAMSPLDVQVESLKRVMDTLSREDQIRVMEYVDRFQRMINKGGKIVELAFTIAGVEMAYKD